MPENGETLPMEQVWRGADASEISDTKLKCQFELPPEVELAPEEPKVMDQTYNTIGKKQGNVFLINLNTYIYLYK